MSAISTSKTHRLYLLLKEQIVGGRIGAGQRLPSEPQLAAQHGVSRVTVRRALDGLARDGLIRRSAGSGTYAAPAAQSPLTTGDLTDMLAQLAAMGRQTRVQLLEFAYVDAPLHVTAALKIEPSTRVQRAVRVRHADKQPFSHLTTFVPEAIGKTYTRRDLAATPLLTLLERSGVVAARAEQTISATLAGPEVAAALSIEIGAPLLSLTRTVFDENGRGVEFLSALYRPELHCLRMELKRAGHGANGDWHTAHAPPPMPHQAPPQGMHAKASGKRRPIKTESNRRRAA